MCVAAFDRLRRAGAPWRIVAAQFGALALGSAALLLLLGVGEALSALAGGVAIAAPNAGLAFAASRGAGTGAAGRFLALAALKWALAGLLMAGALAFAPVQPLGFVAGLVIAAVAGALAPMWVNEQS